MCQLSRRTHTSTLAESGSIDSGYEPVEILKDTWGFDSLLLGDTIENDAE